MKRILLIFSCFLTNMLFAQTTYVWSNPAGGDYTVAANWTPNRITPNINDILEFNSGDIKVITNVITQTIGKLRIINGSDITFKTNVVANTILSLDGVTDVLVVDGTSTLTISGDIAGEVLRLNVLSNSEADIYGTINLECATGTSTHRILGQDPGSIRFQSGSSLNQKVGFAGNVFGTGGVDNIVEMYPGSEINVFAGGNPFGTASKVLFLPGSWVRYKENLAPSFSGRTYANIEIDNALFNRTGTGASDLNIDTLLITNATALNLNLTGNVNIKGNVTVNSGTLTFNGTHVKLNGMVPQIIEKNGSGAINFSLTLLNFTINNPTGVLTNTNIRIPGNLFLTNGVVDLGGNQLEIGRNSTTIGTLNYDINNSYVTNGSIKRWYDNISTQDPNVDFATKGGFPIGTTSSKFASVCFTTAPTTGGSLVASFVEGDPGNNGLLGLVESGITLNRVGQTGYWRITTANGLTGGTYTSLFLANEFGGDYNIEKLVIVKRANTAANWALEGTHIPTVSADLFNSYFNSFVGNGLLRRDGLTAFSEFAVSGDVFDGNPLPINFSTFNGTAILNANQLNWSLDNNGGNLTFTLEKSYDNTIFGTLAELSATQTSFVDYSFQNKSYYRLKSVDYSGKVNYSKTIEIIRNNDEMTIVNQLGSASVWINGNASKFKYEVINLNGKVVDSNIIETQNMKQNIVIPFTNLQDGLYIVRCEYNQNVKTFKIVK